MASVNVYHLTRQDTVYTARELLRQSTSGSEVWLVLPWRIAWARKRVNLELLARAASTLNIDLHVVTRHIETRELASKAGLRIHAFVPPALGKNRTEHEPPLPQKSDILTDAPRETQKRTLPLSIGSALWGIAAVLMLVTVLAGVSAVFVPQAQVTIKPQAEPVQAQFDVTVDKGYASIDYGRAIVPGKAVQVIIEGRGESSASGRMEIPGTHATGELVIANRTSQPITVPRGTIVRTSGGTPVRFYTTTDVELAGQINAIGTVQAISVDAGLATNVGAWTINVVEGEIANSISVLNPAGMYGGGNTGVPVVAVEDFSTVREETIKQLETQAYDQLIAELEEGEFIPADTLEVLVMAQEYDQVIGQQSEFISMNMKVVARGIVIDSNDLSALAIAMLESKASDKTALIESSLQISRSATSLSEEGDVTMTLDARGMAAPEIDIEALRNEIKGKNTEVATALLNETISLIEIPDISIEPQNWQRLPILPGRITLNVSAEVPGT